MGEWKKSDHKKFILYVSIHMTLWKNKNSRDRNIAIAVSGLKGGYRRALK